MSVVKAIIPVSEGGTALHPLTKSIPEEMLPIFKKPLIQYAAEEAFAAGIREFVMVARGSQQSIEKHLTPEDFYTIDEKSKKSHKASSQKDEIFDKMLKSISLCTINNTTQNGIGHAVLAVRRFIKKEQISVIIPHYVIDGSSSTIGQLLKISHLERCSVIAVKELDEKELSNYSVIGIRKQFSPNLFQVKEIVDRPKVDAAPSNLGIIGRYVISPKIFDSLEGLRPDENGTVSLDKGIGEMILSGEKLFAYKIQSNVYNAKIPLEAIKATINFALKDEEIGEELKDYLLKLDKEMVVMQGQVERISRNNNLRIRQQV